MKLQWIPGFIVSLLPSVKFFLDKLYFSFFPPPAWGAVICLFLPKCVSLQLAFLGYITVQWYQHHLFQFLCKVICKWVYCITWNVFLSATPRGLVWCSGQLYHPALSTCTDGQTADKSNKSCLDLSDSQQLCTHRRLQFYSDLALGQH